MKKIRRMVNKTKEYQNLISLREEKITLIDQSKLYIQNYQELVAIEDDRIALSNLVITGKNLKITTISKYFIEINGAITGVSFTGVK